LFARTWRTRSAPAGHLNRVRVSNSPLSRLLSPNTRRTPAVEGRDSAVSVSSARLRRSSHNTIQTVSPRSGSQISVLRCSHPGARRASTRLRCCAWFTARTVVALAPLPPRPRACTSRVTAKRALRRLSSELRRAQPRFSIAEPWGFGMLVRPRPLKPFTNLIIILSRPGVGATRALALRARPAYLCLTPAPLRLFFFLSPPSHLESSRPRVR